MAINYTGTIDASDIWEIPITDIADFRIAIHQKLRRTLGHNPSYMIIADHHSYVFENITSWRTIIHAYENYVIIFTGEFNNYEWMEIITKNSKLSISLWSNRNNMCLKYQGKIYVGEAIGTIPADLPVPYRDLSKWPRAVCDYDSRISCSGVNDYPHEHIGDHFMDLITATIDDIFIALCRDFSIWCRSGYVTIHCQTHVAMWEISENGELSKIISTLNLPQIDYY